MLAKKEKYQMRCFTLKRLDIGATLRNDTKLKHGAAPHCSINTTIFSTYINFSFVK